MNSAQLSEAREQASAKREARMVGMTETLLRVTVALAVIAVITLLATIVGVLVAA